MSYRCDLCDSITPVNQARLIIREMKAPPLENHTKREINVCTLCKEAHTKGVPINLIGKMSRPAPVKVAPPVIPAEPAQVQKLWPDKHIRKPKVDDVLEKLEEKGKRPGGNLRHKKKTSGAEQQQPSRGRRSTSNSVHRMQERRAVPQDAGRSARRYHRKSENGGEGSSSGPPLQG